MNRRKTKIIATLGPACASKSKLKELILAGMNGLRVNFSHASDPLIQKALMARTMAVSMGVPLALLADLQGPKIRIGRFEKGSVKLKKGASFDLLCDTDALGNEHFVSVAWTPLAQNVKTDDVLLINDGLISLKVLDVDGARIKTVVLDGGLCSDYKGINKQGGGLAARTMTDKDEIDLKKAIDAGFDYICLSFVKDASDIERARAIINQSQAKNIQIIAKIERAEALVHLSEIIHAADGIMVARGDLALEIGAPEVPAMQKKMIHLARQMDKMVITATQMMESMIHSPQPTRAEVSDVANAVLDGTDAVMLSGETAVGKDPVRVVNTMSSVCLGAEKHATIHGRPLADACHYDKRDKAIANAAAFSANHYPVEAIVALTESGRTAQWMTRHECIVPVYALSHQLETFNRLAIIYNVFPVLIPSAEYNEELLESYAIKTLIERQWLSTSANIILTRGDKIGVPGGTSQMMIKSCLNAHG